MTLASANASPNDEDVISLYMKFRDFYYAGDFLNAEKSLLKNFNLKPPLNDNQKTYVYINLGATYISLGRFNDALDCYDKAEKLCVNGIRDQLGTIYQNKAIILMNQRSYAPAIEYFEKCIRTYSGIENKNKFIMEIISAGYFNMGVTYNKMNDGRSALINLNRSLELIEMNKLPRYSLVLMSMAQSYALLNDFKTAEKYFLKSINSSTENYGDDYFRLADLYFGYGQFLQDRGRSGEALIIFQKALKICRRTYGEKNSITSLAAKHVGNTYLSLKDYDSSLFYFQKSLISVVNNFNNKDIYSNPDPDSAIFNIRLLDNLKSKSKALEELSSVQQEKNDRIKTLIYSFGTIDMALDIIDVIRNDYPAEESRIYLSENEKETYMSAVKIAADLYYLTKEDSLKYTIYRVVQRAKAANLRNEITGNDLLYSLAIPDSLKTLQKQYALNIAGYNKLIIDELRKQHPDSERISFWKDAVFDMNREKERIAGIIGKAFPRYNDLLGKTVPLSPDIIRKNLSRNETIIDYFISSRSKGVNRKLFTFLLSRDDLKFIESEVDTDFYYNAGILREITNPAISCMDKDFFRKYTSALNYMYRNLINQAEPMLSGKRLIIIPDEEIEWLPFEAFLRHQPDKDERSFEGLDYLINDYSFSYGYSSSLLFGIKPDNKPVKVFAFSPTYENSTDAGSLGGALSEIKALSGWYEGNMFTGASATKDKFLQTISQEGIFHLAMHSMSDSSDSRYSYMLFHRRPEGDEGRLYNYEISLSRLQSPMVVLSACNSGTGTLYSGEGLMSLARSFFLAGASSVVKTAWEVNDEASSEIIKRFYYHLLFGKKKDKALREAKLEYLKNCPPALANPYYWAAYEVLGNVEPIRSENNIVTNLTIISIAVLISGALAVYFRRRRSSSDRSE